MLPRVLRKLFGFESRLNQRERLPRRIALQLEPLEERTLLNSNLSVSFIPPPPSTAAAGSQITYDITVTNSGSSAAANVLLTDALPSGVTYSTQSGPSGAGYSMSSSGNGIYDTISSLDAGASATFTVVGTVDSGDNAGMPLNNTATASAGGATASASVTTTVASPMLEVSFVPPPPSTASAGSQIEYDITVTNSGSAAVANVLLTDALPSGVTYQSQTVPSGSNFSQGTSGNGISDMIFSLAAGATASFTVVGTVDSGDNAGMTLTDTPTASAGGVSASDPVTTTVASPSLQVSFIDPPSTAAAGSEIDYNVTVTNSGSAAVANVLLTDALPSGVTYQTQSGPSGAGYSMSSSGNGVYDTISSLAAGASATFTVVGTVDSDDSAGLSLPDTATASAGGATASASITTTVPGNVWTVVNTLDSNTGDLAAQTGTLRFCLNYAPANSVIDFAIPGQGVQTIIVSSALPSPAQGVLINGYSQGGGSSSGPLVQIDGIGIQADGLDVNAGGVTIQGLAIYNFLGNGVVLNNPSGSAGDVVSGCYIGTDVNGDAGVGNGTGVVVLGSNDVIGGAIVSGNHQDGIDIEGANAVGDLITNTWVGLGVTGLTALGNGGNGVSVASGDATLTDSVVSGNSGDGVLLNNPYDSAGDMVFGCYVGTDTTGEAAVGNGTGVVVEGPNDVIGAKTIVSGNQQDGIDVSGAGATGTLINDVWVGLDLTGLTALANGGNGVSVTSGDATLSESVISGNIGDGVLLNNPSGSAGDVVSGCLIGTNVNGEAAVGNATGVVVEGANDTIGDTAGVATTIVSGNQQDGIDVSGANAVGDLINDVWVGLDLTGLAALGNGANGIAIMNAPGAVVQASIISGQTNGDGINIRGATNARVVDNYIGVTGKNGTIPVGNKGNGVNVSNGSNNTIGTALKPNIIAGNGGNGVLLWGTFCTGNTVEGNSIGLDGKGNPQGNGQDGVAIKGQASDNTIGSGNIISANFQGSGVEISGLYTDQNVIEGNTIGLDSNGNQQGNGLGVSINSGASANTVGGTTAVSRNVISGNRGDGVYLTDSGTSLNVVLGNYIGLDANGNVQSNQSNGLHLDNGAHDNTVGGSAMAGAGNVISGNVGSGVYLSGEDTNKNVISGNYIGTYKDGKGAMATDGKTATGNGGSGVYLTGSASGNTIGGATSDAGNVISGNKSAGVTIIFAGNNVVAGNRIGTDKDGTKAVANGGSGVQVLRASGNTIGGTATGFLNVIAGNTGSGVLIDGSDASKNVVLGNYIGTDMSGETFLGNGLDGVTIQNGAASNTVGGTAAGSLNVISGNTGSGVMITDANTTNNLVAGNYIGTDKSGSTAIHNGGDGVTIQKAASGNKVGGTVAGSLNVISGNLGDGVNVTGVGTSANLVAGDYIGTDSLGGKAIANTFCGVAIGNGAGNNTVGAPAVFVNNVNTTVTVISGNTLSGVAIGTGSANQVLNCYIGTDVGGTKAVPNLQNGIVLNGCDTTTIGGLQPTSRNVISGNGPKAWDPTNGMGEIGMGIYITGWGTKNNLIEGNYIGTDFSGTKALGNVSNGIGFLSAGAGNTIGGTATGAGNVISANGALSAAYPGYGYGVDFNNMSGESLLNNIIGLDQAGNVAPGLANTGGWADDSMAGNTEDGNQHQ